MNLVQRVKDILLAPRQTWPMIAGEATDARTLFREYVMILAAIPPLAAFVGMSVFGVQALGMSMRVPLLTGLANLVISYGLSLAMVYVLAQIADALAPTFGGRRDALQALKLIAYASTAGMVGGIFSIVPALAVLGIVASIYSIYLMYLGVPTLMKTPTDKALPYTAVLVICSLIASVVIGTVSALLR